MRRHGSQAKTARLFGATTRCNLAHPLAPNLLRRNFTTDRPNQVWLADIIYILTHEGWLYLAAVFDLHSRRIVGWAMNHRMIQELIRTALGMALQQRRQNSRRCITRIKGANTQAAPTTNSGKERRSKSA